MTALLAILLALQASPVAEAPPVAVIVTPDPQRPPRPAPGETPPAAWTQGDWVELHRGRWLVTALDRAATQRDGDRIRVRMRSDLLDPVSTARWNISTLEIDCLRHRVRALAGSNYGSDGELQRTMEAETEAFDASAGTARRSVDDICAQAAGDGQHR